MTKFRPCIDLHQGRVKQIVGGTLTDHGAGPAENFVSDRPAAEFAALYRRDGLTGGHVIQLGAGNEEAALGALEAYPGGLQIGGGVNSESAPKWLDAGASHVVVTSWLFPRTSLSEERLAALEGCVGAGRLVVDLSCRRVGGGWVVAKDRWQTLTDFVISAERLSGFVGRCDELLIHAADVEGKCGGIDEELVSLLGAWGEMPVTYAGGARSIEDLRLVDDLSGGKVDLTIGSALDLFGGTGATYEACVAWNRGVG